MAMRISSVNASTARRANSLRPDTAELASSSLRVATSSSRASRQTSAASRKSPTGGGRPRCRSDSLRSWPPFGKSSRLQTSPTPPGDRWRSLARSSRSTSPTSRSSTRSSCTSGPATSSSRNSSTDSTSELSTPKATPACSEFSSPSADLRLTDEPARGRFISFLGEVSTINWHQLICDSGRTNRGISVRRRPDASARINRHGGRGLCERLQRGFGRTGDSGAHRLARTLPADNAGQPRCEPSRAPGTPHDEVPSKLLSGLSPS